eukprot:TRINITY_DN4461_c0_g1_i1.p1 TRINITY_DN4461_c0_g1~~TRINITY_DN4461_c0_g1_i1.p1  ORF type:complete len:340 (+),score=103.83 TRINITY_DN4461_c0_g1_i1:32-1051(+)
MVFAPTDNGHRTDGVADYSMENAPMELKNLTFESHLNIQTEEERYWGGDVVKGQVVYFNKEPAELNNFALELKCKLRVKWRDNLLSPNRHDHQRHDVNRVLFLNSVDFTAQKTTLEAGYHVFPFSFALDPTVTGSMEFKYHILDWGGSVTWQLKAKAERPGLHFNLLKKRSIQVIGAPLPTTSNITSQLRNQKDSQSVPVFASVNIDTVQIFNNKLNVAIRIENLSDSELSGYKVKLKREVILKDTIVGTAFQHVWTMPLHDVASFISKESIQPGEKVWNTVALEVPLDEPPNYESTAMDVHHFVHFRVLKPLLTTDLRLRVDVNLTPIPKPSRVETPV